jgi:hypothetical protein
MGLGYVEGVTHDYYRHGTTTLFAALDVLDGKVKGCSASQGGATSEYQTGPFLCSEIKEGSDHDHC